MTLAIAIGKFDALHLGHRALAERASSCGRPALLRLTGLAEAFGWPARPPLVAESDRKRILATWPGSPAELEAPIADWRDQPAEAFIAWLAERHGATALVVGADFRCGRGRSAGVVELATLCAAQGMRLEVVPPLLVAGSAASSSRVRQALAAVDLDTATACLGRRHRLCGVVQRGDGRGRNLGFPTANLGAGENQAPADGVYAAWAMLGTQRLPAAVNIGHLPTVGGGRPMTIEAHLPGWSGDCYGQYIGLELVTRLRAEERFADLAALRQRIASDVAAVTALLSA